MNVPYVEANSFLILHVKPPLKSTPTPSKNPSGFFARAAKKRPKLLPRDRVNAIIAFHVTSIESRLDGPIPDKA